MRAQAGVVATKQHAPVEQAHDGNTVTRFVVPGVVLAAALI
ncbi:MAG: hypothetical protein AAGD32_12475 [Planctomycetota bacterium]